MTDEYIRREDAKDALQEKVFHNLTDEYIRKQEAIDIVVFECGKWTGLAKEISKQLKQLPAADVVPVVRCDDCKYYGSRRWCELHSSVFDDNAFCSYGERRKE